MIIIIYILLLYYDYQRALKYIMFIIVSIYYDYQQATLNHHWQCL